MSIRENGRGNGIKDEISEALGSPGYHLRYYFEELRERCLGPFSKDLVGVSRFYPMLEFSHLPVNERKVPVVVDFEPAPMSGAKMFLEEKRRFFMEKGIVYIPIFQREILSQEEFLQRYEREKQNLIAGFREEMEDLVLDSVTQPGTVDETIIAEVDALALKIVTDMKLRGAVKARRLKQEKARLLKEKLNGLGTSRRTSSVPETVGGSVHR